MPVPSPDRGQSTDIEVRRVDVGSVYVRVSTIGGTGDRAFVLVPGIGVSADYFEALAPHLNEFGPVHALDLPGFGGVPHPGRALTIAGFADLVGRVVDELGLVDPVLVGHSMGSQVVTELAAARPALSSVVLIGPVVDADSRHIVRQAVAFLRCAVREPGRIKLLALSSYLVCGWRWLARVLPEMMRYPVDDRLREVQATTLLIRGEHDHVSPRPWLEHLLRRVPHGRAWEIPDAAHSVMYAHAAEVALLCVGHARHPDRNPTDDELRNLEAEGLDRQARAIARRRRRTPQTLSQVLRGRLLEWRGLVSRDEDLIARGKIVRGRALAQEQERLSDSG